MTGGGYMSSGRIPEGRTQEYEAIVSLLMRHAAAADALPVARRVAVACLEDGHLWRAMGLASRSDLRSIMEAHFAAFAVQNDRDMRWKRFIYRRLCGWPGFSG